MVILQKKFHRLAKQADSETFSFALLLIATTLFLSFSVGCH